MKKIFKESQYYLILICGISLCNLSCDDDHISQQTLLVTPNRILFETPSAPIMYRDATILIQNQGRSSASISEVLLHEFDEIKEFEIISEDFLDLPQVINHNSNRSLTIRWRPTDLLIDSGYLRINSNRGSYDIVLETRPVDTSSIAQCRTDPVDVDELLCQNILSGSSMICRQFCMPSECMDSIRQRCQQLDSAPLSGANAAGVEISSAGAEGGEMLTMSNAGNEMLMDEQSSTGGAQESDRCFDLNLNELESCCEEGEAHCINSEGIPDELNALLGRCGEDDLGVCMPDFFLTATGQIQLPTCTSIANLVGACLSVCLAGVSENRDLLPQDICASNERCIPCVNPVDGQDLGICGAVDCSLVRDEEDVISAGTDQVSGGVMSGGGEAGSDQAGDMAGVMNMGGVETPLGLLPCCDMQGSCLQSDLVPEEVQEVLRTCDTSTGDEFMCVPNVFLDPLWTPTPCMGYIFFFNPYNGVCLPECLELQLEWTFDERPCPENFVCAPCRGPNGTPTGAPGCEL